jgi:phosphatidate cytidylyltransferase
MPPALGEKPPASGDALGKRIASALILIPATLGAVYAGGTIFVSLVAFLAIVMLFEWTRMIEKRDFAPSFWALSGASAGAMTLAAAGLYPLAYGLAALTGISIFLAGRRLSKAPRWSAFAPAYILAPSIALAWLRSDAPNGRELTFLLFFIVWAADTGGYLGGRLVGGPKMNPAISPAKTWAGAVGGLLLGAAASLLYAQWIWGEPGLFGYTLVGAALGLASILGDMAESAFKRVFGVKDASGFIPGHGGVLDRLDGMIFATTAMAIVLYMRIVLGGEG